MTCKSVYSKQMCALYPCICKAFVCPMSLHVQISYVPCILAYAKQLCALYLCTCKAVVCPVCFLMTYLFTLIMLVRSISYFFRYPYLFQCDEYLMASKMSFLYRLMSYLSALLSIFAKAASCLTCLLESELWADCLVDGSSL